MATIIEMPKLSDTMSVGTLVQWHKKVGDVVANGDILAEVETDKATMELENFDDGTLLEIFVQAGDEVPIGSPLAAIGDAGEKVEKPAVPKAEITETKKNIIEPEKPEVSAVEENALSVEKTEEAEITDVKRDLPKDTFSDKRMRVSPLAKKIALEQNIDLNKITGTGPHGRIIKKDVLQTTKVTGDIETVSTPQSPEPRKIDKSTQDSLKDKTIPVSKMRSIIAKRLLESKNTIPHFYLQKEINALPLKNARASINLKLAQLNKENFTKISINDLILKACAETIKLVPEINSSWEENEIRYHGGIHLAFGVAVEDGLVTPVVRNADQLSLERLSFEAKGLISKARTKKLMPDEMSGSTFTVSNLGMFGIDFFSGIINPPNAAILSIGASVKKAVVDETGNIQAGETMILGLSCDHRLVDGAIGANFLKFLAETLENPASMLV